jgi:hypothetical protein
MSWVELSSSSNSTQLNSFNTLKFERSVNLSYSKLRNWLLHKHSLNEKQAPLFSLILRAALPLSVKRSAGVMFLCAVPPRACAESAVFASVAQPQPTSWLSVQTGAIALVSVVDVFFVVVSSIYCSYAFCGSCDLAKPLLPTVILIKTWTTKFARHINVLLKTLYYTVQDSNVI